MNVMPICTITGTVVHGRGKGKALSMPTANIMPRDKILLPEVGVYISSTKLKDKIYISVTHIGKRPTVDNDDDITIEPHVLYYSGDDFYGETIELTIYKKLREPIKFNSVQELKNQFSIDCNHTIDYFNNINFKYEKKAGGK